MTIKLLSDFITSLISVCLFQLIYLRYRAAETLETKVNNSFVFCSSSPVLLYSGGMPRASYGDRHCLTVQQDKTHVTLDFTSRVIDFFTVHNIEQEKGEKLDASLWISYCGMTFIPFSPVFFRVWWGICFGGVIGRRACCDRPPDPRVAHSAHPLPCSSSLLGHYLLLPHLQCPSQTLGETGECWQGPTGSPANTQGEKHSWRMLMHRRASL